MILTVRPRTFSRGQRLYALERDGDAVLLHSLGGGIVADPWLAHPLPPRAAVDDLEARSDDLAQDLASTMDAQARVLGPGDLTDQIAEEFAGWGAEIAVGLVARRGAKKVARALGTLVQRTAPERRASASDRIPCADIQIAETMLPTGRAGNAWVLTTPRGQLNVVVRPADAHAAQQRLADLVREASEPTSGD